MTSPVAVIRNRWHTSRRWYAPLRALWLVLVMRHETEFCDRCGGRVELVWRVNPDLWTEVTGWESWMGEHFRTSGGCLCVRCFDVLSRRIGRRDFLQWTANWDGAAPACKWCGNQP